MGVHIAEAASRADLKRFIKFPWKLYADDPHYVRRLYAERKEFFGPGNPIFEFTRVRFLLARDDDGRMLGRMTAHINERHNEFHDERTGFFGFFECVDDNDVAAALMEEAERWLASEGMDRVRGPLNFSTNQELGFLIEGFDTPPAVMMPHTKPRYPEMMESLGYRKAKDLVAYRYEYEGEIPAYIERFSRTASRRTSATIRTIDRRNFEEDVARAFRVYNNAWARNWGFVPMTEAQFRFTARNLKPIVDTELALLAEIDGEPIGFFLALPDVNVVFKKMKGRLFPFGIFHFLFGRRRIDRVRVITLGIVEEHRRAGIDVMLSHRAFQNGARRGYRWGEFSWILEDNQLLRRALDRMGAQPYKTYRVYEKSL
ncbi:MAG: N-acetyltransferase [Candidatus Brocadiia bacterium]